MALDLTGFGFTPTEGLVYEVLVRDGPGTGYAIARAAGLARANAYAALEGLVAKGGARAEEGRPRRFRPEPPSTLIARIVDAEAAALDRLSAALETIAVPASPTLVELSTVRGLLQHLSHEIARAQRSVSLVAPADAYPLLTPSLRKAAGGGVALRLGSSRAVDLPFAEVRVVASPAEWPGEPLLMVVDDRGAVIGTRAGDAAHGHWGTTEVFVAAARLLVSQVRGEA